MKTARRFKGSWFLLTMVAAVALGEVVAWEISRFYGVALHPITVAFACIGVVQVVAAVIYHDVDIG